MTPPSTNPDQIQRMDLQEGLARSLLLALQRCLLSDYHILSSEAVVCYSQLLSSTIQSKQLHEHLIDQPWTGFVLQMCLDKYADDLPPVWLAELSLTLLQ